MLQNVSKNWDFVKKKSGKGQEISLLVTRACRPLEAIFSEIVIEILQLKWLKNAGQCVISKASWVNQR